MIKRYYITLGADTTAGGKVVSSSHFDTIDGVGIALEGDRVACPNCRSEGVIALDGPRLSERCDGREVALGDDLCLCKCSPPPRLVASQSIACQHVSADMQSWEPRAPELREPVPATPAPDAAH
ncbi:PAAR domain-containing protein [Massilia sp. G4R7]|uniref:PAAR domain-containing protein n=1 Tax=Massilia phyllostachyos TaxID=2898585 RepID=A0ABS8Q244_9BURK|nr:PAAR domain-containing protein [Massilia phyllostachyos]MCD2515813.1 PAAR domain-containing protein [Massilia phyllostachyos]